MFKKIAPEKILSFLGNESSFIDDIRIMNSVPKKINFFIAGIRRLK
jgi:lycopene beta-cyclase